jgi:hypothetical protein
VVRLALAGTALLVFAFAHGSVLACSCPPPPPANIERAQATAVFAGRVLSVRDSVVIEQVIRGDTVATNGPSIVRVFVTKSWKGVPADTTITLLGGGCTIRFAPGEDYLIYAVVYPVEWHHAGLWAEGCWRTRSLSTAKSDVDSLGIPNSVASVKAEQ